MSPRTFARLWRCYRRLPPGATIFAVGAMLARDEDAVRVTLKDVDPCDVVGLLDELGWPGPREILSAWLGALPARADRIFVNLDVGPEVFPTVGLECKFRRPALEEPRWPELLSYLQQQGLCREEKRRGLLAWPGPFYAEQVLEGETWISSFNNLLSHVKVGIGAGGRVEAKGYFGAWRGFGGRALK
jgi:hypothetical protein